MPSGPDAVIVRTRSLYRDGGEPLIEVIAAPAEGRDGLPLQLQTTLIAGALDHAVRPSRGLTIGDLEELAEREEEQARTVAASLARFQAEDSRAEAPEWLEGFVGAAPAAPARRMVTRTDDRGRHGASRFPLPDMPAEAVSLPEWSPRQRPAIAGCSSQDAAPYDDASIVPIRPRPGTDTRPEGLADRLAAAGFSSQAAQILAGQARPGDSAAQVVAAYLESREVRYPEEHHTALISMQGPVGAGRTTALMRMAIDCGDSGRPALLVAADGVHVAAREQVRAYAEATGLDSVSTFEPHDVIRAATRAAVGVCLFVDTPAGAWQSPAIAGIPHFAYLALPAHWSRSALENATRGLQLRAFAGAILTFTDVATDLTPALSLLVESGLGIAFLSSSRDVSTGIQVADPLMLASGLFTTPTRESTNGRLFATA
jgi:flagellar biosynthesis GTPase FlhF